MAKEETHGNSPIVTVRIPQNLLDKLDKIAAQEGRTRGNLIRLLIEKGIQARKAKQ